MSEKYVVIQDCLTYHPYLAEVKDVRFSIEEEGDFIGIYAIHVNSGSKLTIFETPEGEDLYGPHLWKMKKDWETADRRSLNAAAIASEEARISKLMQEYFSVYRVALLDWWYARLVQIAYNGVATIFGGDFEPPDCPSAESSE